MNRDNIIFVGIIEDKKDKKTMGITQTILEKFGYDLVFANKMENILCFKKNISTLILINMAPRDVEHYRLVGIEFDVLIHNFIKEENYKKVILKEQFSQCQYYILNSDDRCWTLLPLSSLEGVVITYGFSSKATLTISSCNINQPIKATLYLQRAIVSIFGKKIEPFEFIVEMNSRDKGEIYPILAATMLNLILFNGDQDIKAYKTIKI